MRLKACLGKWQAFCSAIGCRQGLAVAVAVKVGSMRDALIK